MTGVKGRALRGKLKWRNGERSAKSVGHLLRALVDRTAEYRLNKIAFRAVGPNEAFLVSSAVKWPLQGSRPLNETTREALVSRAMQAQIEAGDADPENFKVKLQADYWAIKPPRNRTFAVEVTTSLPWALVSRRRFKRSGISFNTRRSSPNEGFTRMASHLRLQSDVVCPPDTTILRAKVEAAEAVQALEQALDQVSLMFASWNAAYMPTHLPHILYPYHPHRAGRLHTVSYGASLVIDRDDNGLTEHWHWNPAFLVPVGKYRGQPFENLARVDRKNRSLIANDTSLKHELQLIYAAAGEAHFEQTTSEAFLALWISYEKLLSLDKDGGKIDFDTLRSRGKRAWSARTGGHDVDLASARVERLHELRNRLVHDGLRIDITTMAFWAMRMQFFKVWQVLMMLNLRTSSTTESLSALDLPRGQLLAKQKRLVGIASQHLDP